jgi:hypothetical protein
MLLPLLVANDNPPTPSIALRRPRRALEAWWVDERRRQQRTFYPIQPPEVPPIPPAPSPEHVCYPRLEIGAGGFARLSVGAAAYSRESLSGVYVREGAGAFTGARLADPSGVPARMDEPDCAHPFGYGDGYGDEYGGTN